MRHIKSLNEFVAALHEIGDVQPIDADVDWSLEIGAVTRRPYERRAPAPLFNRIPEIVIEGHISQDEVDHKGPMGEYPGHLDKSKATPKPVLHVSAVTYRNGAILPVVAAGPPVEEDHTGWGMPHAAMTLHDLQAAGLPVTGAWMVLESAWHWMLVAVAPDWHERTGVASPELAQRIGEALFATKTGLGIPKVLLVEDDFDFTDVAQVVWAFASRAHPQHGEVFIEAKPQNALPVFLEANEKFTYRAVKVIHNCLLGCTCRRHRSAASSPPRGARSARRSRPAQNSHPTLMFGNTPEAWLWIATRVPSALASVAPAGNVVCTVGHQRSEGCTSSPLQRWMS
jgi:3-polyprenyl-4-hydroxybenzoate decarboxylase